MDSNIVELETELPLTLGSQKFLPKEFKQKVRDVLSEYIHPELLVSLRKNNAMIAGGVFASIFTNTRIKDIDVFFRNGEDAESFLRSTQKPYAIGKGNVKVDHLEIIRFNTAETPEKLFETFDILAGQIAYNCATDTFHSAEGAVQDLINGDIRAVKRTNTLSVCVQRVIRWRDTKGMKIHPDTWKLFEQTCNQPDSDFNMFENYTTSNVQNMEAILRRRFVVNVPQQAVFDNQW